MPRVEFGGPAATRAWTPNRQGYPCFLGTRPAASAADLGGADAAVLGVPYVSGLVGQDNDLAPRNVRIAGLKYGGTYLPEFDLDPMERLRVLDLGDVDLPLGNMEASLAAVERAVAEVVEAGCLPITIGGNAPCASYAVIKAISARAQGPLGLVNLDCHCDTRPGDSGPNSSNWVLAMYEAFAGVRAQNHIQIGLRGPANLPDRVRFYKERNIRVVSGPEAMRLGSIRLAEEAVAHAGDGASGIWFAVDYDVCDPSALPDWDEPDPLGLSAADVLMCAYAAGRSGKLAGVSLMMINGQKDSIHRLAIWTVLYALAGAAAAREAGAP